jgi:hypothetical protein
MREWLHQLFSDSGTVSMVRVLSLLCVLAATGIGLKVAAVNGNMSDAAILVSAFLVPAFGGKVWQKSVENEKEKG